MSDEPTVNAEDEGPDLVDVLYSKLQLGELLVSLTFNGIIRDEILLALIRAGLITKERLGAALDEGEKEIADMCIAVAAKRPNDEFTAELLQRMKEKAKGIADHIREIVIAPSS